MYNISQYVRILYFLKNDVVTSRRVSVLILFRPPLRTSKQGRLFRKTELPSLKKLSNLNFHRRSLGSPLGLGSEPCRARDFPMLLGPAFFKTNFSSLIDNKIKKIEEN